MNKNGRLVGTGERGTSGNWEGEKEKVRRGEHAQRTVHESMKRS
jgi:hypothetical protein